MQRRDLLNIFFKGGAVNEPDLQPEIDPVIATPTYLSGDQTEEIAEEWTELPETGFFSPSRFPDYEFSICLEFNGGSGALKLGQYQTITIGIDTDGYLFTGAQKSSTFLAGERIRQKFQLSLEVSPQSGHRSFAKVKLIDAGGLTLSVLKSYEFLMAEWKGDLYVESTGFKRLSIKGRCDMIN